ncbi:hypothetical protein F3N42_09425 [Marinihelvus fidelis]|uniref:PDZ domain-containing protein n=1 Tax=Marinihelvus fidelis TaxID=2613842 RepID=A0A5N0TBS3_9GAMM|nr:hypothetical protein [Marinihelvus fidelis]KAA9131527.1 hypothetical protein F3N42_09425 [Marinihelvus fidelis]
MNSLRPHHLAALLLALAGVGLPFARAAQASVPNDDPLSDLRVPGELCRNYFFVPVSLAPRDGYPEDRTLWFIYDTGNEVTVVDPESLERVSNRKFDTGDRVNLVDATAGDITWNKLPTRLRQLDHLSMALGRPIDGILHFEAFGDYLVTLDYASGELRLDEGRLPEADGINVYSSKGPDDRPWLDVTLDGKRRQVLVDSGAGATVLKIRRLGRVKTQQPPVDAGASFKINRVETFQAARAAGDASLGRFTLRAPTLTSTRGTQLLGGEAMRHFTWTFDPARARMRIVPVDPINDITFGPFEGNGLVLAPVDDGLRVHQVLAGSAAEGRGIRKDDVIVRISGRELLDRDCSPELGVAVSYTLRRDGVEREVTVPPTRFVD